ncbi:MAG TPA: hypothetical protein VIW64_17025 [Pyrinomonadaceae bacterium]|jgi:hypothetical protein
MMIAAFKWLGIQLVVICVMLGVFSCLVLLVDGRQEALGFLQTAVVGMKGPWVWTFGYGLAFFIMDRGRTLPLALDGVLVPNELTAKVSHRIAASTYHRNALRFTLPLTLLGVFLTYAYGIPNKGAAYVLLYLCVLLIYYISGFLLFHFIEVTFAFKMLFDASFEPKSFGSPFDQPACDQVQASNRDLEPFRDPVEFKQIYSPIHLENITSYLAITTVVGLISIYAGFRGTVTAGFEFQHDVWRVFLLTPLILFVPGTLFYDYYPRYVLRKIVQHKVFELMMRLGASDGSDASGLVDKLQRASAVNSQILPFVDYKTLPSYLIAILFVVNLAYTNDSTVRGFLQYLTHMGSK